MAALPGKNCSAGQNNKSAYAHHDRHVPRRRSIPSLARLGDPFFADHYTFFSFYRRRVSLPVSDSVAENVLRAKSDKQNIAAEPDRDRHHGKLWKDVSQRILVSYSLR